MAEAADKTYDFVIIGSGLGGLLVSYLLAERGYSVCVLEKNVQFGGCLQVFSRDKTVFDTGVHYIGELGKGEDLHRVFSYFGLIEKLELEQLDRDAFDVVSFAGDSAEYPLAQGHDNFVAQLTRHFPDERDSIEAYVRNIKQISRDFYAGDFRKLDLDTMNSDAMGTNARDYIAALTENEKLRDVLAGNIGLYAGVGGETPLHQHALILNSYLTSAWRCVDGGAQIAKHLTSAIRKNGGTLLRRQEVVALHADNGRISEAFTRNGDVFRAEKFVANLPPEKAVEMLSGIELRKTYLRRLKEQKPTASFFAMYIKFKPGAFSYLPRNYYHYNKSNVWNAVNTKPENWPESWLFYPAAQTGSKEFMESATVLCYMSFESVEPWANSHNTTANPEDRGPEYEAFKKKHAELLLQNMEQRFPGIGDAVEQYYTSTPLTYRDYLGTTRGAVYGHVKDYRSPHQAFISPRSKVENLFFTGAHVHLHGIKGVTTTAILCAAAILNDPDLYAKVKSGNRDVL